MSESTILSLNERLDKIRSPKLQNQRETAIVLSAIEDTLKDQGHDFTATAYFAALLALLSQAISPTNGVVNKDLATSVIYLLDAVATYVPAPLLRSKFSQILTSIAPALTQKDIEAPLLRHAMGCLETLLLAQDTAAWNLSQAQVSPRSAVAGILALAVDHRPKVRKRALEALAKVLKNPPPTPALDHPTADMCAESALHMLKDAAQGAQRKNKGKNGQDEENHTGLIHALKLVKTIASASGGWPSKRTDALCEVLLGLSRSTNEFLSMTSFEVFETIFSGMANETSAVKLPRLLEAVKELQPSQNDSQLLPPWIAVIARGYDVAAQLDIDDIWLKLPETFEMIAGFLSSSSHNIRISSSECLISFMATCVPQRVIHDPSFMDEKVFAKLAKLAIGLLSVKYQGAWMEVFHVLSAMFEALKWQSTPYLDEAIQTIGELRGSEVFAGKKEADAVLGNAIAAAGPEAFLRILPLNLVNPQANQPGRAWLLPLLRDNVSNATLGHFRSELVPTSEVMFQKVLDYGNKEKTMDIKIYETLVNQIWSIFPGYCILPRDLAASFDQEFAELVCNLLYSQTHLRTDICKALQALVETNKEVISFESDAEDEETMRPFRMSKVQAEQNIKHLSALASNLLAVLFNVYSQTLPHHRGYILQCIDSYLSITLDKELEKTFENVTTHLESALQEQGSQAQADKQKQKTSTDTMPPRSHTLMDLLITLSIHLPRSSYQKLFSVTAILLPQSSDPQLQKKAYKLLPRLATSEVGKQALVDRNTELQQLILSSASTATASARRDRLAAIAVVIEYLPDSSLHFIPSILSEVVISSKEVNEKARTMAYDLLVLMGQKMAVGGIIDQSKIPHMATDASTTKASLEEYFTMVSAGLAGSTPHMISASVTALTRILYEFRSGLSESLLQDLVATMDLFLTSKNREIVRSVLGFIKVAVISLPDSIMASRLTTMIPSLLSWSHEHKNQFRSKVKHVIERAIRRFGYDEILKSCPEEDKKLIINIHKTRERKKRKKLANAVDGEGEDEQSIADPKPKGAFASEFDEAIYGSASSDSEELEDPSDADVDPRAKRQTHAKNKSQAKSYIVESGNDPLDLLDKKAFASISSTKPVRFKENKKRGIKAKTDLDGKLVFDDSDDDVMSVDTGGDNLSLEKGINAYVEAIRGRNAAQRGRGGRIKFSNRPQKQNSDDESDAEENERMDMDPSKGKSNERRPGARSERKNINGRGDKQYSGSRGGRGGRGGGRGFLSSHNPNIGRSGAGSSGIKGGRFKIAKHRARQQGNGLQKRKT